MKHKRKWIALISDSKERYNASEGRLTVKENSPTLNVGDSDRCQQRHYMTIHVDNVGKDQLRC